VLTRLAQAQIRKEPKFEESLSGLFGFDLAFHNHGSSLPS
jgi:hypothetical protein